jgi:hypothetical protein
MKILIYDIIKSEYAVNYEDGLAIFNTLELNRNEDITISFDNVSRLSTLFLNESLGKFIQIHPELESKIHYEYPDNKPLFKEKVKDVIENALMGDEYDEYVYNAKMAL